MYNVRDKKELKEIIKKIIQGDNSILLQDIDISNIDDLSYLFFGYNIDWNIHNISHWDVRNVIDMFGMFAYSNFNQDISQWDVRNVTDMSGMFAYSDFNRDISSWNIRNVTDMSQMFYNSRFCKDLSNWKDRLNNNVSINDFNLNTPHKKLFGTIKDYDDFMDMKSLDDMISDKINIIKSTTNDRERYQLIKDLKTMIESTEYKLDNNIELSISTPS